LRWYVDGFAARSGIDTRLDVRGVYAPFSELETTLFRIVQESLTNIHRHSGSPEASIRLTTDAHWICLEVRDQAMAFQPNDFNMQAARRQFRNGIAGMKNESDNSEGKLTLSTSDHGTT